jgi:AraC-like DNA-binding protein
MDSAAPIPILTVADFERDLVAMGFAIRRLEALSAQVMRTVVAAHRIRDYQVIWISGGQGTGRIDLNAYDLRPPMMCFLSPGQIHAWETRAGLEGFVIVFKSHFFADSPDDMTALAQLPYFGAAGALPVLSVAAENAALFTSLCERIAYERQGNLFGQMTLVRSYMRIILIEARRLYEAQPGAILAEERASVLTRQFMQLVEEHYPTTSSVADYAMQLHVTPNHLSETVRLTTGQPAGQIIHERLLLEAKRLLSYADLPVADIASHLNFEDPSYFSRFFKKHLGVSPLEFRNQA